MKSIRRVHFKIESFPKEIQIEATTKLGKGWSYGRIRAWLAKQGYTIAESSVGRWALAVHAGKTDFGFNPAGCPLDIVVDALRATKCRENCQRARRIEKAIEG
jgi:hypothetical protein